MYPNFGTVCALHASTLPFLSPFFLVHLRQFLNSEVAAVIPTAAPR